MDATISIAAGTLAKARFFLGAARSADPGDRPAVANNVEASIVYARSVTFHLQSEFAHRAGFGDWYKAKRNDLGATPLCRYFLERRNYALKQGPVELRRIINVSITETIEMTASVSVQVIRARPWYRRSPRILIDDFTFPLRQRLASWKQRCKTDRAARNRRLQQSGMVVTGEFFFDDAAWSETPAFELLQQYLAILEAVIVEAQQRFLFPPTARP